MGTRQTERPEKIRVFGQVSRNLGFFAAHYIGRFLLGESRQNMQINTRVRRSDPKRSFPRGQQRWHADIGCLCPSLTSPHHSAGDHRADPLPQIGRNQIQ